jgi:RimJ/RimL family protein N-acetyltransferase
VGGALLAGCIDWARRVGAHKVALQVFTHNEAAVALYRRFGFVEEGVLRRHYRRRDGEIYDAIIMGLPLDHEA